MSVVDDLRHRVGTTVGVGDWLEITQERIDAFADATGDRQWIHVDAERAAAGPFGATIAHGFLLLSLIPSMAPQLDVSGAEMAVNYGLDRVRFVSPVPVGSRIRATTVLQDVAEATGGVQVTVEVTVDIEHGERPACVATCLARYYL